MARAHFKNDPAGYRALKRTPEVVAFTEARAEAIARAAEAASGEEYEAHAMTHLRNPDIGVLGVVATASYKAAKENAQNNTLLKSINAGRF